MDFDKLTEKTKGFLQKAQTLAMRHKHQSLEPEHLLKVMLDDEDGLTVKLVQAAGGNVSRLKGSVEAAIAKFPVVEGPGAGQIRLSSDVAKIVDNALGLAEKSGDKYVTAERVLQAMAMAKKTDVAGILEDAKVTDSALNKAVNDMRKGRTAGGSVRRAQ